MDGALSLPDYLLGLVTLAAVLGGVLVAAWLVVHRRLPALTGAVRAAAMGIVSTALLVGVHVIPAALGILAPGAVVAASLLALLGAWRVPLADRPAAPRHATAPASGRISWGVAAFTLLAFTGTALAVATRDATQASTGIDMVNFHLPDVATWIRSGSLWQVIQFVPFLTHGNYPNNGDFVLLAATLPWDNDFLVRLSMLPFLVLMVLGTYACARELAAPPAASLTLAAASASVPIVLQTAVVDALPDTVMYAMFAAGLAFLVRHHRTAATADLVLAGVALGIAFGTKWYGVSAVLVVLAVWAGSRLLARQGARVVASQGGLLVALVVAAGGIWLLRNLVESGNPVFPVKVRAFGLTLFDAPRDRLREIGGHRIADHFDNWSVWQDHLLPAYRDFVGWPGLVLAASALVAAVYLARASASASASASRAPVGALLLSALLLAAMYVALPYSAQGTEDFPAFAGPNTRYLVPALLAATPAAAWVAGRLGAWGLAIEGAAALAVLDGLGRGLDAPLWRSLAGCALVALVAAVAYASRRRPLGPRAAVAVAACLLVAAVAALGYEGQDRFNERRYRGVDATFDWVLRNAPEDERIALAGNWSNGVAPPFPMFGPQFENEVDYLGPWEDEMLRTYRSPRAFRSALRRGRYDLLVVGRGFTAAPGSPPGRPVREERWARAAGLQEVAQSDTLTLFRVRG